MRRADEALLEREEHLGLARRSLDLARGGSGRALLLSGEAGIGKTRLLRAISEVAEEDGWGTLRARGGELERELAFGVARQLLEPALGRADDDRLPLLEGAATLALRVLDPANAQPDKGGWPRAADAGASMHGLYWLCANLAERQPHVLVVDDLHWCDEPSLRFLSYLARRLEGVAILLLLAARPGEPGTRPDLIEVLETASEVELVGLDALSESASSQIVRAELCQDASDELCLACARATGGNPFLLRELLRSGGELRPDAIATIGPPTIARNVITRVARLGAAAVDVARAVAVLGPDTELRHVAALARLELDSAATAADVLAASQVLERGRTLHFLHPVMRTAVYRDLAPNLRARLHARAAETLSVARAPVERVAKHLLEAEPAGARWALDALLGAAREAHAQGAPDSAVPYLRRALAEPPPAARWGEVVGELGTAETLTGAPEAVEHLEAAISVTPDSARRAFLASQLGFALLGRGEVARALDRVSAIIDEVEDGGADRELVLSLEGQAAAVGALEMHCAQRVRQRLTRYQATAGRTPGERLVLAMLAWKAWQDGTSAATAADLAERALGDGRLLAEQTSEAPAYFHAIWALIVADRLDAADSALAEAQSDAARRGIASGMAIASAMRATVAHRRGALAVSEAQARGSIDVSRSQGEFILPTAVAYLIDALLDQARIDEAQAELDRAELPVPLPELWLYQPALFARARLRLAQGASEEGVSDLQEMQRRHRNWQVLNPVGIPWRLPLAAALAEDGEPDAAGAVVTELRQLAERWGTPRALGLAQLAEGLTTKGSRRIGLLRNAAATLEGSPGPLERARALIELGAALRRANQRSAAKDPLRSGLDLAHRCGAAGLAARAREELVVAGARPRRDVLSGVDALTAGERRVAELAAAGMTNRQIAQILFVTMKTVEMHLTHSFHKLDIRSRKELPGKLGGELEVADVALGGRSDMSETEGRSGAAALPTPVETGRALGAPRPATRGR